LYTQLMSFFLLILFPYGELSPQAVIPSEAHEARVRAVEGSPTIITMPSAYVVRTSSARRPHVVRTSSVCRPHVVRMSSVCRPHVVHTSSARRPQGGGRVGDPSTTRTRASCASLGMTACGGGLWRRLVATACGDGLWRQKIRYLIVENTISLICSKSEVYND
jgi:hypothetical protein